MAATSTTEAERFTPSWREGEADAPVYLIRAGGVIERDALEAELAGTYRAPKAHLPEIRQARREGVLRLLADDPELDRVIELIDRETADGEDPDPPSPEDQRLLTEIHAILAEHWPDYRDLMGQIARRQELLPTLAFRRFVVGWENVSAPFTRDRQGMVSDASLRALDPLEMKVAGLRAYTRLYPETDAEKNSAPPSSSDAGPTTSTSGGDSATDGKSTAKSGRKTPA